MKLGLNLLANRSVVFLDILYNDEPDQNAGISQALQLKMETDFRG